MIASLLIANRGEIARRIIRTCRRMGIRTVAVHSDADTGLPHTLEADEAVRIGPAAPQASYLNAAALVAAARDTGCEAVHPGYGFLSENAGFARAVEAAGLVFVGPSADTIKAMGDKARAKALMAAAGVPTVPGSADASDDPDAVAAMVAAVGFPALLKPVAGGGGKGMRVLRDGEDAAEAAAAAIRVARGSFGDGRLLVERFVEQPRHVEVQVFGDRHGNLVHLFERECSLQRRHQKIVEEAPAPCLDPAIRARLHAAAVDGARAIGYRNAGTFEFILGADGAFYFLEVNTRLQVEHPVTEAVTGLDLVEWQLRVASGEPLPLAQDAIRATGHAVEARLYAEDPEAGFRPAPGRVLAVRWPEGLRVDAAVADGSPIPAAYDPMVGKLIAHGPDRATALDALAAGLRGTALVGLTSNLGHLAALIDRPEVRDGTMDTGLVDRLPDLATSAPVCTAAVAAFAGAVLASHAVEPPSPWAADMAVAALDRRNLDPDAPLGRVSATIGGVSAEARLLDRRGGAAMVAVGDARHSVAASADGSLWRGTVDGVPFWCLHDGAAAELQIGGLRRTVAPRVVERAGGNPSGTTAAAPLPGAVAALPVAVGDAVRRGQTVAVVEAMKMEIAVDSPADGLVMEVPCTVGAQVVAGQPLVVVAPAAAGS